MKKRFFILLGYGLFFSFTQGLSASDKNLDKNADGQAEPPSRFYSISAGAKIRSNLAQRGATFYDSWQVLPILYIGLWENRIQFLVSSLEFRETVIPSFLRLRTKLNRISDKPLYRTGGENLSFRNERPTTTEWTNTAEVFLSPYGEIDFVYAKDIQVHHGDYLEFTPRAYLPIFDWIKNNKLFIRPEVFATLGFGSPKHNQYYYGLHANTASFNFVSYGLQVASPARTETIYPLFQIYWYEILGTNRSAQLVKDKPGGVQLNATFALSVLN